MAAGQGRGQARDELETTLRSLAEGLRVVTVLLTPYIPESAEKLLAALGAPDIALGRRASSARTRAGSRSSKLAPLFPKPE